MLAIGVTPDTALAKEAGLELGIKESIVVNDRMETSVPDIYAAGDAVQVKHYVTGNDALISLAGPANKQGRIIADNICGGDSRYLGSQGSSVIKVFDMTAATTGINETNAKKSGLEVDTVILSPMSHAGYYPGGKVMTMKVVFEKETYRLLGAQIIGYEGVDKRIDVLATAIHAGLKASQLKDLGSRICTTLLLCKGSCKYGWIHGGQHRKRNLETVAFGRYRCDFQRWKCCAGGCKNCR